MLLLIKHGEQYDLLDIPDGWDYGDDQGLENNLLQRYQEWNEKPRARYESRSFTQWLQDRGAREVTHLTIEEWPEDNEVL